MALVLKTKIFLYHRFESCFIFSVRLSLSRRRKTTDKESLIFSSLMAKLATVNRVIIGSNPV